MRTFCIASHEAAHALAALHVGATFNYVHLDPGRPSIGASGYMDGLHPSSLAMHDCLLVVLSGPMAEAYADHCQRDGTASDWCPEDVLPRGTDRLQVAGALEGLSWTERCQVAAEAQQRATDLVTSPSGQAFINQIAALLIERGRLEYAECAQAYRTATGSETRTMVQYASSGPARPEILGIPPDSTP